MPIRYVNTTQKTDELTAAKTQAIGTMAIVGKATGGTVNSPELFTNSADAINTFGGGALVNAVSDAFGQDPGPAEIWVVREDDVGGATSEIQQQLELGNTDFLTALAPLDSMTSIKGKVNPSTIQSLEEYDASSSTIFRQDGAATKLFAGMSAFDAGTGHILIVVTDKNHVAVPGASVTVEVNTDADDSCTIQGGVQTLTVETNDDGWVEVSFSGFEALDKILVWSVDGDLDSAIKASQYTNKDGTPDDDCLFTFDGSYDTVAERTADSGFFWFSESSHELYGVCFDNTSTDLTSLSGHLDIPNVGSATTKVDFANNGSNIGADGTSLQTVTATGTGAFIAVFTNDATASATWMGWVIDKVDYEANTFIRVQILSTSGTPATIISDDPSVGSDIWTYTGETVVLTKRTDEMSPVLHTYTLLSKWNQEDHADDGTIAAAAIIATSNLSTGEVFLNEPLGYDDEIYMAYTVNSLSKAMSMLENKEFRLIALAGKYSTSDLRTFTRFIESRKAYLPTYGCFALQSKSTTNGNGKEYSMSKVSQSNYVSLFAHDDAVAEVAAATAGAAIGVNPWDSLAFLVVQKVTNLTDFTNAEINSFTSAQINVLDKPLYYETISPIISWGLSTGTRKKADIQMTLNFIDVEIKRIISNPATIGKLRVSALGITIVKSKLQSVLSPLIETGVIGDTSQVVFPLLTILSKPASQRTLTEQTIVQNAQNTRDITGEVQIDYQGSIETIGISVRMF